MTASIELSANEIQGLCQRYLSSFGQTCVDKHQQTQDLTFQVLNYVQKPTTDTPAGFLGRHRFLTVRVLIGDTQDKESVQDLRFFTKAAPTAVASHMSYVEEYGVFKKEILVYSIMLPQLEHIFRNVSPKCYYAQNNLLVFEDLASQGYKMAAARDGILNYEHLNCVLKTLAALHASSIVFEVQQRKKMTELCPDALQENAYPLGLNAQHVRMQNFNNVVLVVKEIIKELPQYSNNLAYILQEMPKQMARIFTYAQTSTKYKNVFSHGDLWANNIMFQYGKFGEVPTQCRFVDFQLARYAPPILDVITVLTIPSSRQFRAQYLDELVCNYYRFIGEFLKREHLCIEDYIPKQQFFDSAKEFRICGIIESCLFSHLTILPPSLTLDLLGSTTGFDDFFSQKRVEICMKAFHTDEVYRERMIDMITDLVDNYVLKSVE